MHFYTNEVCCNESCSLVSNLIVAVQLGSLFVSISILQKLNEGNLKKKSSIAGRTFIIISPIHFLVWLSIHFRVSACGQYIFYYGKYLFMVEYHFQTTRRSNQKTNIAH